MQTVKITCGSDSVVMGLGPRASDPILLDGQPTQYETADARHEIDLAVELIARECWGAVDIDDLDWELL